MVLVATFENIRVHNCKSGSGSAIVNEVACWSEGESAYQSACVLATQQDSALQVPRVLGLDKLDCVILLGESVTHRMAEETLVDVC